MERYEYMTICGAAYKGWRLSPDPFDGRANEIREVVVLLNSLGEVGWALVGQSVNHGDERYTLCRPLVA